MRVTKYNSDGSVNTVREYHEPLPSYVTSFDENHSFLNISDIDIAIASQNKNSFEKTLVLEKMRFLISKDYKNYLDSTSNNENVVDFVEELSTIPIDFEYWDSKDKILSSLLRCYNKSYDSYGLTDIEKLLETLVHGSDLLEVILYHILQYHEYGSVIGPHYLPENEFCKSFLNVIHRLYYSVYG